MTQNKRNQFLLLHNTKSALTLIQTFSGRRRPRRCDPRMSRFSQSRKDNRNSHTNFVNEPWTIQYLKDRRALPVNFNPTVVLTDAKQEFNRPTQSGIQ